MRLYTIKEIKEIVDRSEPSIYAFMRNEAEFFKAHRQVQGKGGYLYDEDALEVLKLHYGVSDGVGMGISESQGEERPLQPPAPVNQEVEALKAELEDARRQYKELQAQLEKVEAERKQLLEQNGNLLLLLSQIQAEKQALLPPPRKTIGERLKSLFQKT